MKLVTYKYHDAEHAGDVVECEIDGIGVLKNPVG